MGLKFNMNEAYEKTIEVVKSCTTEPVMKIVNQRLSNPFFLCFISSWLICNWDRVLLVVFLFSKGIDERIEMAKSIPSNSVFWGVSLEHAHTFWYPLIATLIFVIATPFISYRVDIIQNGVITKKKTNDSHRKQNDLDLKKAEIIKNVEFEHADEQARLTAKKATKEIELDIQTHQLNYDRLKASITDLNFDIKQKTEEARLQDVAYKGIVDSIAEVQKELDSKNKELKNINSKIIGQQKRLDDINYEISKLTIPMSSNPSEFSTFGGLGGLQGTPEPVFGSRIPSKEPINMNSNGFSSPSDLGTVKIGPAREDKSVSNALNVSADPQKKITDSPFINKQNDK